MILYLDTSALVKKYALEAGSSAVIAAMAEHEALAISSVGYAETLATFYKKLREKAYSKNQIDAKIREFKKDWHGFIRVNATADLNDLIDYVLSAYALKGFDALHLSSALLLKRQLKENMAFACFDAALAGAARSEGFIIVGAE